MHSFVTLFVNYLICFIFAFIYSANATPVQNLDYINFVKGSYGKNLAAVATERGLLHFDKNFTQFCSKYKKEYFSNEELEFRKGNFLYSLDLVQNNNRDFEAGRTPYRLGVNRFADFVS